jgi:hypothetical protein
MWALQSGHILISPSARLDLSDLKPHVLCELNESELVDELRQLQRFFTLERDRAAFLSYVSDPRKVAAYTLFYLPTNLAKWDYLWSKLSHELKATLAEQDFVDMGSGPGTFSLAFLASLEGRFEGVIHLVDHSSLMLEQAKRLIFAFYPHISVKSYESFAEFFSHKLDEKHTLFFGHSLNELDSFAQSNLLKQAKAQAIMWIEPGTPAAFKQIIPIRGALIDQGFFNHYPCMNQSSCPLARESNTQDWCHQVIHVSLEPEVARLAQILELNRHELPMMAHVFTKQSPLPFEGAERGRILRVRKETKHSFEWDICAEVQGGSLEWIHGSLPKRGYSKAEQKKIGRMVAGDEVSYGRVKELAAQSFRIELQE